MFLIAQCYKNEDNMTFMDGGISELLPLSYDFLQIPSLDIINEAV